jgi:hypothetical protein
MKCNVGDCQNKTDYRCSICGEPVCLEHGEVWLADGLFAIPATVLTGNERLCYQCANKLQRVCVKFSRAASYQASEHDTKHGSVDPTPLTFRQVFIVLAQPT